MKYPAEGCVFTLLLQKQRIPQIQDVQGRSRSILLRALGNEGDGASSAFPPGKKCDKFFLCFRSHQKFIREPYLNIFKCPVIILFIYTLSCFLCNCRVYCLSREVPTPLINNSTNGSAMETRSYPVLECSHVLITSSMAPTINLFTRPRYKSFRTLPSS